MRYRSDHKPRTRERIVDHARRAFMTHGHTGAGVDRIMNEAGLTAGGFYSHFESKDQLFAQAIDAAFESSMEFLLHGLDGLGSAELLDLLTRRYLSRHHRDHVDEGCPMPPLAADASRLGGDARAVFERRIRQLLATMTPALDSTEELSAQERALALLALYVGGIALSRATAGGPLSNQLLLACRKQARSVATGPAERPKKSPRRSR